MANIFNNPWEGNPWENQYNFGANAPSIGVNPMPGPQSPPGQSFGEFQKPFETPSPWGTVPQVQQQQAQTLGMQAPQTPQYPAQTLGMQAPQVQQPKQGKFSPNPNPPGYITPLPSPPRTQQPVIGPGPIEDGGIINPPKRGKWSPNPNPPGYITPLPSPPNAGTGGPLPPGGPQPPRFGQQFPSRRFGPQPPRFGPQPPRFAPQPPRRVPQQPPGRIAGSSVADRGRQIQRGLANQLQGYNRQTTSSTSPSPRVGMLGGKTKRSFGF
tara:strand:+ start:40 stop:843 length:804 start_codon:yes stop_codon:yes gene_type:complete